MSDDNDPLPYAIGGIFVGVYFFIKGFRTLKRKRLIENTPTSKTRSLAMGLVEVCGEALPYREHILKSPFSASDCVYYRYRIEEYRKSGKNNRWVTVKTGVDYRHFYLKDDTGQVLVNPDQAEVDIPSDNIFKSASAQIEAFLSSEGLSSQGWLGFGKTMRFTEHFIAPRDFVYILGTAEDNPHVDEGRAQEGLPDVLIGCGDKKQFFYIADKSEKECVSSHSSSIFFQIFGGAALTLACLAYVLYRFELF